MSGAQPSSATSSVCARAKRRPWAIRWTGSRRRLGEISLTSLAASSTVDLRSLPLGRGTFKIQMKIKADGRSRTVTRTLKTKSGYSPSIIIRMRSATHIQLYLTVRRNTHRDWVLTAAATAKLG